ncbi:MAG: OmpA family protein, partial [Gammaproteobacteria bacterium]
ELIGAMDGAVVMLEGHADSRGDAAYNEALSAARAEHVRQIFIDAGVPAERIAVTAEGENQAVAEPNDVDGLALERRVSISIMGPDSGPRVARKD